jgi:hypothetical protein
MDTSMHTQKPWSGGMYIHSEFQVRYAEAIKECIMDLAHTMD